MERALSVFLAQQASESLTEPLALDNIQGNIVPGFGLEFQELLFFRITDNKGFKDWLQFQIPLITTAEQVRSMRPSKESWTNIAFTAEGLKKLGLRPDYFEDKAFKQGMARRSEGLGDPKNEKEDGHESQWQVGGKKNESHFMLIVGSSDKTTLSSDVKDIKQLLERSTEQIHSLMGG
jgi:hypothetical protein